MRHLLLVLLSALFVLLVQSSAEACSCQELDPSAAFAQATAVFEGRVVHTSVEGDARIARLRITRAWKGVQTEEVTVTTPAAGGLCGISFEVDSIWLVYAEGTTGRLSTDLCRRTRPIDEASDDLATFGAGVTPVDPHGDSPAADDEDDDEDDEQAPGSRGGCASCSASGGPVSVLSPLLIVVLLLRRRTRAA